MPPGPGRASDAGPFGTCVSFTVLPLARGALAKALPLSTTTIERSA